jgi:hypothetical protein
MATTLCTRNAHCALCLVLFIRFHLCWRRLEGTVEDCDAYGCRPDSCDDQEPRCTAALVALGTVGCACFNRALNRGYRCNADSGPELKGTIEERADGAGHGCRGCAEDRDAGNDGSAHTPGQEQVEDTYLLCT